MKKKVLLKSVAVMMSVLMFAPCFGDIVSAANSEEEQRGQYKRQRYSTRYSTEEAFTEAVGEYIVENKATYMKAAEYFGVTDVTVANCIKELKETNLELYDEVCEVIDQNKNRANQKKKKEAFTEAVGEYIVENKATYKQVADNFGISVFIVGNCIKELKKTNPELYNAVKKIIDQNKIRRGRKRLRCFAGEEQLKLPHINGNLNFKEGQSQLPHINEILNFKEGQSQLPHINEILNFKKSQIQLPSLENILKLLKFKEKPHENCKRLDAFNLLNFKEG